MTQAVQPAATLGRNQLYAIALVLGLANTAFQGALADIQSNGALASLANLFGISALVWAGAAAMLAVLLGEDGEHEAPRAADWALVAVLAIACLLPMRAAAAGATTLLAVVGLTTSQWRGPVARASILALSCVAALYWGRVLLAMTGTALLDIDVLLAGTFGGLEARGNLLLYESADPLFAGEGFMVAAGCSSLHGISIALLAFVLVTQFYNLPFSRRTLLWGAVGVVATIAVNIARLSAMGHFPQHFEWLHVGTGAVIAAYATLLLVLAANLGGNWKAITTRA